MMHVRITPDSESAESHHIRCQFDLSSIDNKLDLINEDRFQKTVTTPNLRGILPHLLLLSMSAVEQRFFRGTTDTTEPSFL